VQEVFAFFTVTCSSGNALPQFWAESSVESLGLILVIAVSLM